VKDAIQVMGIRAFGYLGVLPEERTLGQWFEVNLTIGMDLSKAGRSDRLEDTYDYRDAIKAIQTFIETTQVQLIEAAAEAIAAIVLSTNSVEQVKVHLIKLAPPIPNFSGSIAIDQIVDDAIESFIRGIEACHLILMAVN
jgi:7,8-dihydroneopterin aldolase/epimerase/oxygenase